MKKILGIVTFSLILLCGGIFAGCDGQNGPLTISFGASKIEMLTTDESVDYTIKVENYEKEASFDFGFETAIAKVVPDSFSNVGNGQYQISIAPIAPGETVLKITLRGTDKFIDIPVHVSEVVQSFAVRDSIFVIKGQSLTLNSNYFAFTPVDTTQTGLNFALKEGQTLVGATWDEENSTLTVDPLSTQEKVTFVATSVVDSSKILEFDVKIVSEVNLQSLNVVAYGQSEANPEIFDPNNNLTVYPYNKDAQGNILNNIELVVNNSTLFQKKIAVSFDFVQGDNAYIIEVAGSKGITGELAFGAPIKNKTQYFDFVIQSNSVTTLEKPHKITLTIYQADYPDNKKDVEIFVYVTTRPTEIRINEQSGAQEVELYHNSVQSSSFRLSIFPDMNGAYNEESYYSSISVFTTPNKIDLTELELGESGLKKFAKVTYGGKELADFTGEVGNDLSNIARLDGILNILPKEPTDGYIAFVIKCFDEVNPGTPVCSNTIFVKIYKGTSFLTFNENFTDGIIYLAMPNAEDVNNPQGIQLFQGFSYEEGSTIGKLIIEAKTDGETVCDIKQNESQTLGILLTPRKVGESEFILQTQNGKHLILKVIVVRQIEKSDFSLQIEDNIKNSISEFNLNETTGSVESIVIKGKEGRVYLKENIKRFEDVNSNSYSFSLSINDQYQEYFTVDNNVVISNSFTEEPVTINVALTVRKVQNFMLIDVEYDEPINFDFYVECVDYYKSLSLTVKNESSKDGQKAISVYDQNVLSYTNKNLAKAYLYLDLEKSDSSHTHSSDISITNFSISAGRVVANNNNWAIRPIGYFNITRYDADGNPINGEDYIAEFICNIQGINTTEEFTITLKLKDETGVEFESYVTIHIEEYIDVDSIYTTVPVDNIYLDSTAEHSTYSLGVYVMPTNAMCQDVHIVIDTRNTNCISYSQQGKTIVFSYVSGGEGTIRLFPVSKMKTSSTTDNNGEYYYHISIKFRAADGRTEETALKLTSYEGLSNIEASKHYFIDSIIDCDGKELFIQEFSGSIRGTFEVYGSESFDKSSQFGGIINFVVNNHGLNSGFIGTLNIGAKIYNLSVSGIFNTKTPWELTDNSRIGLLCGTNKGEIHDVQVTLQNNISLEISTHAENGINAYLGIVAGENANTISIRTPKISTLMVYMQNKLEVNFGDNITANVGGAVGVNSENAILTNAYSSEGYVSIGMFGININVNIKTNANYLGGVVGDNKGNISNIKATGEITGTGGTARVGGLIGIYSHSSGVVSLNTSRVYVRGYSSYVAGLIGGASVSGVSNIKANKVQATDDGTKTGVNASLIIKYNSGTPHKISSVALDSSNIAETYYTREVSSSVIKFLPIDYYYGDMICVNYTGNDIYSTENFTQGAEEVIAPDITTFVLAVFKQAENSEKQKFINNNIKSIEIINIAGITANELSIEIDKYSLASLINFGESLAINNTGLVKLTISSSLNYKNSCTLDVYLTRYYTDVKAYSDKDHIETITTTSVVNAKSNAVYFKCYSNEYNYQNTPIALCANEEITFTHANNENLIISVAGQTIHIVAKEQKNSNDQLSIYPLYVEDGKIYYSTYNNGLGAFVLLENVADEDKNSLNIHVNVLTGIENIQIGKAQVLAEPSDNIQIEIEYNTYNTEDYIVPKLQIENRVYNFIEDGEGVGHFEEGGNILFNIQKVDTIQNGNHVKETYNFTMEINRNNYLNYKNQEIMLYFYSSKTNEFNSINIKYTPETISSVLINNYNFEENDGMIKTDAYKLTYEEENMVNSSSYSSSGDYNILKTFVYTQLSEFDYVEISMNSGRAGGYLALGKNGEISTNSVYTEIDGVVTMRVYKTDIITDSETFTEPRMLEFSIIYSLPVSTAEGAKVPIEFVFFKNGETAPVVCYQKEINVIAKSAKKVQFTIYDKETVKEDVIGVNQIYSVVKGKKYPLEVNIVGYNQNEVFFDSSNPNIANISYENGVYFLNITNGAIQYGENPYFEIKISSYGQKQENNTITSCKAQVTLIRIYDFVLNDEKPFDNNQVSLRVLNTVDIRDVIVEKLKGNIEYSTYSRAIDEFIETFKQKATWELVANGITIEIKSKTNVATSNYILKDFTFKPLVVADEAPYKFRVHYKYAYKSGVPTCSNLSNGLNIISGFNLFDVEVYINSNEELPIPVYNYKDLTEMKDGEYYRLVSDITIKGSEFAPIKAQPTMLDGNGYTIYVTGETFGANLSNISNFGLFEEIDSDAVFKNITINLQGRKTLNIDNNATASSVNIGVLTAVNNGVITNCKVICENILYANVIATVGVMENSYFGTVCAINNGYITHTQVEANISVGGASIGGFVANNLGKIASSYVKNSRIANTTSSSNEKIVTGGFVCSNDGQISMSYIEGAQSTNKIYSDYVTGEFGLTSKILYTSSSVGGFVYENSGKIEDSYANIPIVSSSRCAGFVAVNRGTIERAFSLSKMKQRDTLNYAFIIQNEENSQYKDCFFVIEAGIINDFTSESNYKQEAGKYVGKIPGIEPLTIAEFNVLDKDGNLNKESKFANFITGGSENSTSGIWFYTYDKVKQNALYTNKLTYLCDVDEFKTYDINTKTFQTKTFSAGRLQLVSPNIIATSKYELTLNSISGEYYYSIDDNNIAYGSKYNPYIISSANELEEYAYQRNSNMLEYYRLVKDINYEQDEVYSTNLYNKQFIAYFEGNNFEISEYGVNSKSALVSAGLFAQIGGQNAIFSTLKNVNFAPSYINLPNSVFVGSVAGSIVRSRVYNISLNGQSVVIAGKNVVGGLFGRTYGETYMEDIYANIAVKSSQYGASLSTNKNNIETLLSTICYREDGSNRGDISYAGGLIGYASGAANISRANVGEKVKTYGVIAGLMFGGIGSLAKAYNINLELNSFENSVTSYAFGGIIAGESNGEIYNVSINSNIIAKTMFTCYPIVPVAIAGVAGLMGNGKITNISSTQGFSVIGTAYTSVYGNESFGGNTYKTNYINNPFVVKYVGGIVGYGVKGEIMDIFAFELKEATGNGKYNLNKGIITSNTEENGRYNKSSNNKLGIMVSGGNYVGAVAGYLNNGYTIKNWDINLIGHKEYTNANGEQLNEMVYMSYVSESAYSQNPNFTFDETLCEGLLVGYVEQINNPETLGNISQLNITASGNHLFRYFGKFGGATSPSTYRLLGSVENITSEEILSNPIIFTKCVNLSTGA